MMTARVPSDAITCPESGCDFWLSPGLSNPEAWRHHSIARHDGAAIPGRTVVGIYQHGTIYPTPGYAQPGGGTPFPNVGLAFVDEKGLRELSRLLDPTSIYSGDEVQNMIVSVTRRNGAPAPAPDASPDAGLQFILNAIRQSDDPFAAAGQWLTKVTNAITEVAKEVSET